MSFILLNYAYTTQIIRIVAFGLITLALSYSNILAAGSSLARSAGMGGAYIGLARGVYAAYYNPANLGLSSHRQTGIQLFGVGMNVTNNAFSLEDYNRYTGAVLTTEDKNDILNKTPVDGLIITADAEASLSGFSSRQYSLTFTGYGAGEVNLGHEALELLLFGNSYGDTISLEGMYGSAWSYASADISYGIPIHTLGTRQLALGISAHYIKGFYLADITRIDGFAATLQTGFQGDGAVIARTADGGSGYSIDLGAALRLNKDYTIGLSLRNVVSRINWTNNPEETGFIFSFDSITIDNSSNDSVFVTNDYTTPIDPFSSSLPSTLRAGIANTSGKFIWAFDWEQGFSRKPGSSAKPQISAGAEYTLVSFLPLRAGIGFGGRHGSQLAFGSGLHLSAFQLDFAVLTSGSTINASSNKGARFSLSAGLFF